VSFHKNTRNQAWQMDSLQGWIQDE